MELGTKLIAPLIGLILSMIIKAIFYSLNLLGEREKHLKSHLEFIKDLPPIESVGNSGKIKLLFEEAFALTYKASLSFHEIKALLENKSPRKAISKYLAAYPYITIRDNGRFAYQKFNKLRIDKILIPFPLYRMTLVSLYIVLSALGIWLLNITTPDLFTLPSAQDKNAFSTYINTIGAWLMGLISLTIGIQILVKFFKLPMKSEILMAIHQIDDKELVIVPKDKFYYTFRKLKYWGHSKAIRRKP
jgi:hypothetical protein